MDLMARRILIVDDNRTACEQLAKLLQLDGHETEMASGGQEALARVRDEDFHLIITDWRMPDLDGIELLHAIRSERLPMGVIVVTGYGDTDLALSVMKAGADDFLTKPFDPDRLRFLVHRILERRALIDELSLLRRRIRADFGFQNMVSKSPKMRRIFDVIEQVGPLGSTVLIHGETGTGKELAAMAVHAASRRRGAWVAVNCAAIQDSLLESELFGHERGAFTDADRQRQGMFERADKGTLFLDEIGDISPSMQAKLLRVLQSGQFERVGGSETIRVDVRIVAASNKRLEDEVEAGRFRRDLFFRLSVIRLDLPPLRERPEDIPLLAAHFLEKLKSKSMPPVTEIDHEAMQALLDYSWPGNVRELENAIRAAVAMADGTIIHRDALPTTVAPTVGSRGGHPMIDTERPLPEVTDAVVRHVEREYLAQLLAHYRGNIARCARHSGLSRRSITQKLQKYGLNRDEFRIARERS